MRMILKIQVWLECSKHLAALVAPCSCHAEVLAARLSDPCGFLSPYESTYNFSVCSIDVDGSHLRVSMSLNEYFKQDGRRPLGSLAA